MKTENTPAVTLSKARTGIEGFDEITHGGLPRGRTTLLEGGPGSGKTIMALQSLVHAARFDNEPGIFVAFEESAERIVSNAATFGWDLEELQKKQLFFLDVQPDPDMVVTGSFDLCGMLAALEAKAEEIKARRIVFDAVDVLLALLENPVAERREIYRLHEWLLKHGFTALITAKFGGHDRLAANQPRLSFMQFMVDCAVILNHEVIQGVSQRNMRVVKYRGSTFAENESPFLIGGGGLEVAGARELGRPEPSHPEAISERVSSGVRRLDAMLGGGYYRGAGILVTGFPGTAKSTLSGAFAEAACLRGERTLFISFDSDANEVIRNLASVHIELARFVEAGLLRLVLARAITGSAEIYLMQIKRLAKEHQARCVIIDPVSAMSKTGNENTAHSVGERLIDWTKAAGITLLCTSLLHEVGMHEEGTPMHISTIADTWIHLNYLVHAGERNRGLSIIKSRGTAHSNQVRELVLSDLGVTLADAYTAGGEVLMGTLRWEKEDAVRTASDDSKVAAKLKQATLETEEALLEVRLKAVQLELQVKRAEKVALNRVASDLTVERASGKTHLRELRGVDKA
ncbi:MAG: circadian clock protein KaiC [Chthoniobacter sp.]|jgi:circadian clock protein KaiC|nr:circadian clock protein KaiC [Chthoniobacter sp.]